MDFDVASIDVVPATLAWGPYRFSFQGALPDPMGDPIVSAQVRSYHAGFETTAQLIQCSQVESTVVKVWFNFPGSQYRGKHTIICVLSARVHEPRRAVEVESAVNHPNKEDSRWPIMHARIQSPPWKKFKPVFPHGDPDPTEPGAFPMSCGMPR